MDLTPKERQGRGLDALAKALRPYVELHMAAAIEGKNWVALYEAKESHRRGRPFRLNLSDPRQVLQMIRYERRAFTEVDPTERAYLEELIQAANRAAHTTALSDHQANRALDTMQLLASSLGLDAIVPELIQLRLTAEAHKPEPLPAARRGRIERPESEGSPTGSTADGEGATPERAAESRPSDDDTTVRRATTLAVDTPPGVRALTARIGGMRFVAFYQEAINLALAHNNVPPIRSVEIINDGDHAERVDRLEITIDTPTAAGDRVLSAPLTLDVGELSPGQMYVAQGQELSMRLNPATFLVFDEAVTTQIRMSATVGDTDYITEDSIRLLAAEEWWATSIPESLAAFVRPNDAAVTDLLKEASAILGKRGGSTSLEGYQSGPLRVKQIAEAIYDAVAAREITYLEPPASFEGTGQRIRTHAQVLRDGVGTCLDLACTYAAALEQAGIHPILITFDGHAFTGYLAEDDQLPAVVVRDHPTAKTIIDSDIFEAVELTCVCQRDVSFDQARERTHRWWAEGLDKLSFLLDVDAAHHRVRPLPTIRQDGDIRVIEVDRDPAWAPARRPAARTEPRQRIGPQDSDTPSRIKRWERALLDMTYANPLLRRKAASSIGIQVPDGSLGSFEDMIADGNTLRLVSHDAIDPIHRAQGARTAADIEPAAIRAILEQEQRVFVATDEQSHQKRLTSLARRSKTALEETGSDTLYLTLGTLQWDDGGRRGIAPLFLVPIKLHGGRGARPFSIGLDDTRDRVPNYCLIEKLKTAYGLDIPELEIPEEDDAGIDVSGALAAIRTAILKTTVNTYGFFVEEDAHLALLQFSTLDLWQDLRTHWSHFAKRPVVRHLVEEPGALFDDGIEVPEPKPEDEATTYLPIPADGSQIEAVRWAAAGKTFILEGPPGTGKSQTITNLIAHSMAQGQKVLFVAEKSAALDVVRRRLDQIGLGVFSLDLHGPKQSGSAVREQLQTALEDHATAQTGWEPLQSAYATLTAELAEYPKDLHQLGPVGLSAWDARQLILEQVALGADEAAAITVGAQTVLGDVSLSDLYADAGELGRALRNLGSRPDESPWRICGALDPDALDRESITRALVVLRDATQRLDGGGELAELTAWLRQSRHFESLATWLDSVEQGRAWPTGAAARIVDRTWLDEADRRRAAVARFRAEQDLGPFTTAALSIDVAEILGRSQEIDRRLVGKKKRRAQLLGELSGVLRHPVELTDLTRALTQLRSVRDSHDQLREFVAVLPAVRPRPEWCAFDDRDVAWLEGAVEALKAAHELRSMLAGLPTTRGPAVSRVDHVSEQLTRNPPADDAAAAVRAYGRAWSELCSTLQADEASIDTWLSGRNRQDALAADLPRWEADAQGAAFLALQRWRRLNQVLDRFRAAGVDDLVQRSLSGELSPLDVEPQLRVGVAQAVLTERLSATGLVGFDEKRRDGQIDKFMSQGDKVRRRMPNELRARVIQSRTFDPCAPGQIRKLRSELSRRRHTLSVRRLLHEYASLITEITPCLLMSPHSVARFLGPSAEFDIVVFDEASQIRVPEAIGAIGRAKATVIVGDSKQMPPTAMFSAGGNATDGDEGDDSAMVPVDLESILSEAVESQLPRNLLTWHYRSRDETLIAFSNTHYYDGRLSSFPAPPCPDGRGAIELRRINGIWEGGAGRAARVNRDEADAIIKEIRRISREDDTSIGVVTFNSQQRDLILDLLESAEDPDIERQLQREIEPLFVKNLETVQGDERDVILFSLAFSEDERGRVPLNWGPLTRAGGERRLNVAITRAKAKVVLFASFDPKRLDLTNSSSQGLSDLKDYLLHASSTHYRRRTGETGGENKHLENVAQELREIGLEVVEGVGLSDFVVDLAVREPSAERWVAVLLDGPGWADRRSVGDQETLPRQVLNQMGWAKVERIWLPSWLRDRATMITRIRDAAADAGTLHADDEDPATESTDNIGPNTDGRIWSESEADAVVDQQPDGIRRSDGGGRTHGSLPAGPGIPEPAVPIRQLAHEPRRSASSTDHGGGEQFVPASQQARYHTALLDSDTARSHALIRQELESILKEEAPILRDRLVTLIGNRFGLQKVHASRKRQLEPFVSHYAVHHAPNGDLVVWREGTDPNSYTEFRTPMDGQKREITAIPYDELRNAMVHLARAGHGMDRDSLLRETRLLFGIGKLGSRARPRLERVLADAIWEGRLVDGDGVIRFADKE